MKERPILFSAPMVRAILDGTKMQTRRVVKPIPAADQLLGLVVGSGGFHYVADQTPITYPDLRRIRWDCPYGQPGDMLWVRETWRIGAWSEDNGSIAIDYQADGHNRREWLEVPNGEDFLRYWQQSTDDAIKVYGDQDRYKWEPGKSPCRWRPSIHMPRWASRTTLEITGVRVERLQDISRGDAMAEGCPFPNMAEGDDPRQWFAELWAQINGAVSWDANPWVWVVEFSAIKGGV